MSMDASAMSTKLQRSFVTYNTGHIFGLTKDSWSSVKGVNKDVEEALLKLFTRLSPSGVDNVRRNSLDPPDSSWTPPSLYVKDFTHSDDNGSILRHFNMERVHSFLLEQGHIMDATENIDIVVDYRLRQAAELLRHMRSKAQFARGEGFLDDQEQSENVEQDGGDEDTKSPCRSKFKAYNSPFEIRLVTPERNQEFVSPNAPSIPLMFITIADELHKLLSAISNSQSKDLVQLEKACLHIDLFMGRKGCGLQYLRDILDDYQSWGYVALDDSVSLQKLTTVQQLIDTVKTVELSSIESLGRPVADVGFSFAPCGCMIPYHLGVLSFLSELNVINLATPLSGGSAGSLTVIASSSFKPNINELMLITEGICEDVRSKGSYHRLDDLVRTTVDESMEPGAFIAVNKRIGELRVAMAARRRFIYRGQQISEFHDNIDLRDALRASCNIPGVSASGAVYFRGQRCYDGYFAARINQHGCLDTAANRTVRINPFHSGRFEISLLRLDNRYVSPLLVTKDVYVVHYLRLKCLIKALWERKLTYESAGRVEEWIKEVTLMIDAYESMTKEGTSGCNAWSSLLNLWASNGCTRSRQPPSETTPQMSQESNISQESEPDLANLFMLVVASETALKVGPSSRLSTRNWSGSIGGVNLVRSYGRLGLVSIFTRRSSMLATPYCLIDWLQREISLSKGPGTRRSTNDAISNELALLRSLRHLVLPPLSLVYYYTEFPYLLPNGLNTLKRMSVAINSAEHADIRYVFDVGRSDAFRWLICEYIAFENWLDLRVRQLEELNDIADPVFRTWEHDRAAKETSSSDTPASNMHRRQHEYLRDRLDFIDQQSVTALLAKEEDASDRSIPASVQLERLQGRLARRAILLNAIDPHYSHLLSHNHLWKH
ncbi:hypothetical protein BaOVIS_009700 [Babesia ovis]|uniref:PNPLA domain-containing protein n=1 Tax=Babesia ovis TaxID=5869 RepID=A0A9W5T9K0_BABOV|nr:hypothetical protein BaOVIS_009700 [Babesia ovis]